MKQEQKVSALLRDLEFVGNVAKYTGSRDFNGAVKHRAEVLARREKSPLLRNLIKAIAESSNQARALVSARYALNKRGEL